ncbi:transmembrane signal receptor [Lithospermum erythrorhizon]|uniref:Transmembrane signal receptor n=1 Tax=Lithospermum erythrorhizon TaxID=34254 RepID=A0AAV3RPX2_LITER
MGHIIFLASISTGIEPRSFKVAMKDEGWREAMHTEIQALEANETWNMVALPEGKQALGSRWIYKEEYNSDGSVEWLKARLVVFGNHQVGDIDYSETFASVAKMVTVRAFLAVAAVKNWEFIRWIKSLYGLKQAPRCWFSKLVSALKWYGFHQSYYDYSLFTLTNDAIQINVLIYVDDLIISGNDSAALVAFKHYLGTCFHMKNLGVLKYFLDIEVARSHKDIFLCQRKYALDIIFEGGLLGAKPASFPLEQNHHIAQSTSPFLVDVKRYRRLIRRLIYLSFTRPDLSFSVHIYLSLCIHLAKITGVSRSSPMRLHCDSQSALHLAHNPVFHERTKHIEVDCHFLRDALVDGTISMSHVSISDQLVDIFTKVLGKRQFEFLLSKLGISNLHAPT